MINFLLTSDNVLKVLFFRWRGAEAGMDIPGKKQEKVNCESFINKTKLFESAEVKAI